MPRDFFFPDAKEPHIHVHKGGIEFTDIGHNHRTLVDGDQTRENVAREVAAELQERGDERSLSIAKWITENLLS